MARYSSRSIRDFHLGMESFQFSMFTTEQLRKICSTKISTQLVFDALGHPMRGGLYDRRLGPTTERSEPCETCRGNYLHCPGHLGYIELPLPVVNPIFHKSLASVLKLSCLKCYKVQIPEHVRYLLLLQLRLLDVGKIAEASELEDRITEVIRFGKDRVPESVVRLSQEYESLLADNVEKVTLNRNTESLRNSFGQCLKEFASLKNKRGACIFCQNHIDRITATHNRIQINILHRAGPKSPNPILGQVKEMKTRFVTPRESKQIMREIWSNDREILTYLLPILSEIDAEHTTDVLFFEIIPVLPPNTRPAKFVNGRITEHPQTQMYKTILNDALLASVVIKVIQYKNDLDKLSPEERDFYNTYNRLSSPIERLNSAWEALQSDVDAVMDKTPVPQSQSQGLKQVLEKKVGLIRMHMMGKRVNFAARSVIAPDPCLDITEIGIPEEFATRLTYPEPVTPWNVEELRKMIMNGPKVHPGATMVEMENGQIVRINPDNKTQQEGLAKRLMTPLDERGFKGFKRVYRHLKNGDVMLLNRQPTLHKPSIMAHTARILKGERTLRLHYANCKAYNADFDGDEMNAHFPQNELARAEAYNLVNVSQQYLVPKDGTPLSGLIQDHVIGGVKLSLRGKFYTKSVYNNLVFEGLDFKIGKIKVLPPAIIKPQPLWSGKQVISTVIINCLPDNKEKINMVDKAKITAKAWQNEEPRQWKAGGTPFKDPNTMSEAEVVIRQGELLVGVLDKQHYGSTPYGLIHCVYELYGGKYATRMLSAFGKVFIASLKLDGFTLGIRDILVLKRADKQRQKINKRVEKIGKRVMIEALSLPADSTEQDIVARMEQIGINDPKMRSTIDRAYKSALDSYTNEINKACLPAGLLCKFPDNNLQLMVQSGAKGSTVNTMQISCLLGQIELEGKRPPVMISGKFLPGFPVFEFAPRAGGFIAERFLTGIQPEGFFHHCMAGREGLIDTACKTARSGYLQRCLVKNLEGLTVAYDMTVRDSDGSVIQFLYGEDGMDVVKSQFLTKKQLGLLNENCKVIVDKEILSELKRDDDQEKLKSHQNNLKEWREKHGNPFEKRHGSPFNLFSKELSRKLAGRNIVNKPGELSKGALLWHKADDDIKDRFRTHTVPRCPDPTTSIYQPDRHFGSVSERLEELMENFECSSKKKKRQFQNMIKTKASQSLAHPGEPVGLLAAQSIGEPSTQMTLNTFHFAGRGDMNVTLGIPRLREILMMASKNIKTPSMEIPFLPVEGLENRAEVLRRKLTRVVVADVLEKVDVTIQMVIEPIREHRYTLRFYFLPHELYRDQYYVKPKGILKHMKRKFYTEMSRSIRKFFTTRSRKVVMVEEEKPRRRRRNANEDDEEEEENRNEQRAQNDSSEDEVEDDEDAKTRNKMENLPDNQESDDEEVRVSDNEDDESVDQQNGNEAVDNEDETTANPTSNFSQDYTYDKKDHLWCEYTFSYPLNYKRLDMTAVLKEVAGKSVIRETPHIKRAITYVKDDRLTLRTDGINISEMYKHHEILDLNRIYCNDIHKVQETFGIEAARSVMIKEVQDVFNVYGIQVDRRHLTLIADHMMFSGSFEPLNRKGMENSASPLQQMTFESSLTVLKKAVTAGKVDRLQNPSSRLVMGQILGSGTGCLQLRNSYIN